MTRTNLLKVCACLGLATTLVACGGTTSSNQSSFDSSRNITLYTRDTTSGTRDGFFTGIGLGDAKEDNAPLKDGVVTVDSNGTMMNRVAADVYGLGYISLSTLSENDSIKGLDYDGVEPTEANVLSGDYELTRNFNYIKCASYSDSTKEELVNAFIAYMSTQEGKAIIQSEGGIVEIKTTDPTWASIASQYPAVSKDNSSVTLNFGGSTSVSNTARALAESFEQLAGGVNFSHNYLGSGDAYTKTQGSNAGEFDLAFASREFNLTSSEPAAEGTYGTLAIDAIVAVCNIANPYEATDAATLVSMYTGKVTTWAEVID